MATFTVAELKDQTCVPAVANWSDVKILLFQATAESILASLDLDSSMTGYGAAYEGGVMMLFDWLAENPTGLKSSGKGKVSKSFAEQLPLPVQTILKPFIRGSQGTFTGARFKRSDIGRR